MSNAQRALIVTAGLFLAMALISLVVNLFGSSAQGAKRAQDEFTSIQRELAAQSFITYDETSLTGSQVINAIRKFSSKDSFGIYVQTGKHQANGDDGVWYNHFVVTSDGPNYGKVIKEAATGNLKNALDEYHDDYINPSGSFRSHLIYNKNQQIVGIMFIQE